MVTKKRIPPPEESCFSKLFGKKKEGRPMSMNQSKQEHADTWEKELEKLAVEYLREFNKGSRLIPKELWPLTKERE